MKSKNIITFVTAVSLLTGVAFAGEKAQSQLESKAKVTRADAEKTALTKAPNGTVKDAELEEENGMLVWSFDIARPGTKDITEVQVDALTGKIAKVEMEKPKDQAKEAKEDAAEKK